MDEKKAPITHHLADLRTCIIRSLIGLGVSFCLSYAVSGYIMEFLKQPMLAKMPANAHFVVLTPYEYFFTEFKAALYFGLVLASPFIFAQIWSFVAPGLYLHEKRFLAFFVIAATACFIVGTAFAYYLIFPPMFEFFISTLPPGIMGTYSISMLFGFAMMVLISFGIVFQTPLAVFLLVFFELISIDSFKLYRRHIFVLCFIVGAILTPPDPLTQVMLALPMYALFELGLWFASMLNSSLRAKRSNPSE